MLWELLPGDAGAGGGGSSSFGSSAPAKANVENWSRVAVFTGHSVDVVGLAWSPDGHWLASCSLDNTVCVWEARAAADEAAAGGVCRFVREPLAVLKGHQSTVKGLAWDPIGKYVTNIYLYIIFSVAKCLH
jgi:protein HIRA/HIR1